MRKYHPHPTYLALLLATLAFAFVLTSSVSAQVVQVGSVEGNFKIVNHATGAPINLTDFAGKIVVLDFFAYWCQWCATDSPLVEQDIAQYYAAKGGNPAGVPVVLLSISTDQTNKAMTDAFIASTGLTLVGDDVGGLAWAANAGTGIPTYVILNGLPNAKGLQQWQVLCRESGYSGPAPLRQIIDSIQPMSLIAPAITGQPADQSLGLGRSLSLSVQASGTAPLSYQWYKNGAAIDGATSTALGITAVAASDAGSYTVKVTNSVGSVTSSAATVTVGTSRLSALSVRTQTGTGADVLFVGVVIGGGTDGAGKQVVVRGEGPALAQYTIVNYLPDPVLSVYSGSSIIASNDDWDSAALEPTLAALGLNNLTQGSKDAVLLTQIGKGNYAFEVQGKANQSGVALEDIYETDRTTAIRMKALSVRAMAGTGEQTLMAGLIISGTANDRLVIRGLGPALASALGTGYLADPLLQVYSGSTVLTSNDNWVASTDMLAAFSSVGLTPMATGSNDAALIVDLPPGAYTVWLTGVNNTTGIGLIEIYELP